MHEAAHHRPATSHYTPLLHTNTHLHHHVVPVLGCDEKAAEAVVREEEQVVAALLDEQLWRYVESSILLIWSVTWSMWHTYEFLKCTKRHTIMMQCIPNEYDTLNRFACNYTNHISPGSTPQVRHIPLHPTPTHTLTSTTARCPF